MTAIKILYVDDEEDIRQIATMSLSLDPSLQVQAAGSGEEALAIAESWSPDLVLLDVMMPGMDGPTTLECLRSNAATCAIPVVFITARTQTEDINRYLALGAMGVIAKPFSPMTLAQEVKSRLADAA